MHFLQHLQHFFLIQIFSYFFLIYIYIYISYAFFLCIKAAERYTRIHEYLRLIFVIFSQIYFFFHKYSYSRLLQKHKTSFFFYYSNVFLYFNLCNYFILNASYYPAPNKWIQGYATQALATTPVTDCTAVESTLKMNIINGNHKYNFKIYGALYNVEEKLKGTFWRRYPFIIMNVR